MVDQKDMSPEEVEKLKQDVMKSQAVRMAMFEVVGENRDEIVKRARAKLVAMGVELNPDESLEL